MVKVKLELLPKIFLKKKGKIIIYSSMRGFQIKQAKLSLSVGLWTCQSLWNTQKDSYMVKILNKIDMHLKKVGDHSNSGIKLVESCIMELN